MTKSAVLPTSLMLFLYEGGQTHETNFIVANANLYWSNQTHLIQTKSLFLQPSLRDCVTLPWVDIEILTFDNCIEGKSKVIDYVQWCETQI